MLRITLKIARGLDTCQVGYSKLARHLGGVRKYGRDKPVPLTVVLDVLGLNIALWCLGHTLEDSARLDRLFAADCAEHMLKHFAEDYPTTVGRLQGLIEGARRFAKGEISETELEAIRSEVHESVTGPLGSPDSLEVAIDSSMCCAGAAPCAPWVAGQALLAIDFKIDQDGWSRKSYEERRDDRTAMRKAEERWQEARLREYLEGGE